MKAAVVDAVSAGFKIAEVELAHPLGREVLIDIRASGLCHTDLRIATQDVGVFPMPVDSLNRPSPTKGLSMTSYTTISPQETADRLAIRELIDAYALWPPRSHRRPRPPAASPAIHRTPSTRAISRSRPTGTCWPPPPAATRSPCGT